MSTSFCGQCGYLLTASMTRCPRCGSPVEVTPGTTDSQPDHPTIFSQGEKSQPATPYGTPTVAAQPYAPPTPAESTYSPRTEPSSPGFVPSNAGYSPPQNVSQPGFATPPYTNLPPRRSSRWPLVLGALALIFVTIFATTLIALGPERVLGFLSGNKPIPVPTATTVPAETPTSVPTPVETSTLSPTPTPTSVPAEQQARSVVEQYYAYINNKSYRAAYELWVKAPQSYEEFEKGFENTERDEITFGDIIPLNDGAVRVNLNLTAYTNDQSGNGIQQEKYRGYYIVGPQSDKTWKIITASMVRIAE